MGHRRDLVDEAGRRARRQLDEAIRNLLEARSQSGLSQQAVASRIGVTRQLISLWERGEFHPNPIQLARWAAVVGLDVTIRAFPAGSPLRDTGQLRTLGRARRLIGEQWSWRAEVPVSTEPLDRRAVDAVIKRGAVRIGLEIITRLSDAQAQVRAATLKQEAAGLDRMILILADTQHNRAAVRAAAATLNPAFPLSPRGTLLDLRAGRVPGANAVVFV